MFKERKGENLILKKQKFPKLLEMIVGWWYYSTPSNANASDRN